MVKNDWTVKLERLLGQINRFSGLGYDPRAAGIENEG